MQNPTVSFDGLTYRLSLFRSVADTIKEEKYSFGEHALSVCGTPESELASWERAQIKGPVSDDGELYYLCAHPEDVGRPSFIWLQDKKEALALRKAIEDAEYQQWSNERVEQEKEPCTFCGEILRDCGGDHVDEMREIQREALSRD
jgi:REP element-mobilizing transposase RayT